MIKAKDHITATHQANRSDWSYSSKQISCQSHTSKPKIIVSNPPINTKTNQSHKAKIISQSHIYQNHQATQTSYHRNPSKSKILSESSIKTKILSKWPINTKDLIRVTHQSKRSYQSHSSNERSYLSHSSRPKIISESHIKEKDHVRVTHQTIRSESQSHTQDQVRVTHQTQDHIRVT